MKKPNLIRLTSSPMSKKISLIPLPSLKSYPETMDDDVYTKPVDKNEDNKQNNSESISELESL